MGFKGWKIRVIMVILVYFEVRGKNHLFKVDLPVIVGIHSQYQSLTIFTSHVGILLSVVKAHNIYIYILISWYMATCTCVFFPSCTLGMGICQMFAWHTRLNLVLFIYFTVQQQNSYKHRINLKGWNHCFNVDRKWWAQLVVVVTNNVSFLIATLKLGIAHLLRLVLLRRHR